MSRHPWSVEHLRRAELVPVSVGSALQNGARASVDVKKDGRMVCVGVLAPRTKHARKRLDAFRPRLLALPLLKPPPANVCEQCICNERNTILIF